MVLLSVLLYSELTVRIESIVLGSSRAYLLQLGQPDYMV